VWFTKLMSQSPRVRIGLYALGLILVIGIALILGLKKTVSVSIDGQTQSVTTYAFTVGNLLHESGIPLSPLDEITPSIDTWLKSDSQVTLTRAIPVQILADGQIRTLFSADRIPSELFAAAGVNLLPGDQVLNNGQMIDPIQSFPQSVKSISLQLLPLVSYSLTVDGKINEFTSTAQTLGAALWSAGYTIFDADHINPPINTPLTPDLSASIQTSQNVTVQTQDANVTIRTVGATVGEALRNEGLSIQGLDYSIPPPEAPIPPDGIIRLVHGTEDVLVEQSPLAFETQYQPDPDLEIDNQSVLQAGEYGLSAQRVRIRYADGQEVSRQVENQWVARQSQPRIIGYGTSLVMHSAVVDGVPIQYWRALNMYATSYHPSNTGSTTASGLPLKKGVAAVDRSLIPFYTQMYVPGYGEVLAADIGGGVAGRWIDLGYSDDDYVPWHQWVTVYFLWPPPDNIVWIIP
jgi:uncharacterized protein YabE (DUF348 family)